MSFIESSDYNPSSVLFGLEKNLSNIIKLHKISRLPKVLMLSGDKGIGKFGIGLPNASVSQCKKVEVYTWQKNKLCLSFSHFLKT